MTTIKSTNGVTLSANATTNDDFLVPLAPVRGDFADRLGGRIRRKARRQRIMAKRAWLN